MGDFRIVKTRKGWLEQAANALARLETVGGGQLPAEFADSKDLDPSAFADLVQALHALGEPVSKELLEFAGLRDINEVI